MSRAEESALKAYPKMSRISEPHGVIPADNKSHYLGDANEEKREGFIEGYHQAEKDLALSWENMLRIDEIISDTIRDSDTCSIESIYQEVLRRFNEQKRNKV